MELDSAKAVSPEGEGRPSCSWAGRLLRRGQQGAGNPSLLLATAESRQFQPRKGSNCAEGGSHWGCAALRSWERELRGTFIWSSVTGEREISRGHSGFSVVGNDQHVFCSGCREERQHLASRASLARNFSRKCTASSGRQALPWRGHRPGFPQAGQARLKFNHTYRHQGLPI